MADQASLIACARQLVGVRFQHQGRSAHGLDCLGLLLVAAHAVGIHYPQGEVPNYGTRPDTEFLKQQLDALLVPVEIGAVHMVDIVLLKVNGSPQHLAMLSDYPQPGELGMIHAYAPARKVVEHRYDEAWRAATCAAYRLPQLI